MVLKFVLIFLFCCIFSLFVDGQLSSYVGLTNIKEIQTSAIEIIHSSARLIKDLYYAKVVLEITNKTSPPCPCSAIPPFLDEWKGLDTFFALSLNDICNCKFPSSDKLRASIKSSLRANDLLSLVGGALAAKHLNETYGMRDVIGRIKQFMQTDGTFSSSMESMSQSSVHNTLLVLDVLEKYTDSSSAGIVSEIYDIISKLLPTGEDSTIVNPLVLYGLSKLSTEKRKIGSIQLGVLSESLLNYAYSSNMEYVARGLLGLSVIRSYKTQPIYVSLQKQVFPLSALSRTGKENNIIVKVENVLGEPVECTDIEIKSFKKITYTSADMKESSIFSGKLNFLSSDSTSENSHNQITNIASLDLSSFGLLPGKYMLKISVQVTGRKAAIITEKNIIVSTSVEVQSVYVGIVNEKDVQLSDLTHIASTEGLIGLTANALQSDIIHVVFHLKTHDLIDKSLHQVFVRFTHVATGTHSYIVSKYQNEAKTESATKFSVIVALSEEFDTFMYYSGMYELSILVGDEIIYPAVLWNIGTLNMSFPTKPRKNYPLYVKSLLAESDNTLVALPEISHKMRAPVKQASSEIANTFTALITFFTLLFIGHLFSLSPNLQRCKSIWNVLHASSILLVLVLYTAYWFAVEGVSFYQTIKYLCVLAPFTIITGRYSLAAITTARLAVGKRE